MEIDHGRATRSDSTPGTKRRLLVVDDQRAVAFLLADLFESRGFETRIAFGGDEAAFLAKPFGFPEVVAAVESACTPRG
jgi:CheY-like chemotaxis protein